MKFGWRGLLVGWRGEHVGNRKRVWCRALVVFAAASVLSAFANSFVTLLGARLFMGLVEGPLVPLMQSLLVLESPPERRGLYMGIVENLGSSGVGSLLSPPGLVPLRLGFILRGR